MVRTVVHKVFNGGEIPVDVVVETHDSGVVVEYPAPSPRLVLTVDSPVILADGQSAAAITVREEAWSLVDGAGVWSQVPATDVTVTVNLRALDVAPNAQGALIALMTTTTPGTYRIEARKAGYLPVTVAIEALV